eukprot:3774597-Rhodomonas_salina.4
MLAAGTLLGWGSNHLGWRSARAALTVMLGQGAEGAAVVGDADPVGVVRREEGLRKAAEPGGCSGWMGRQLGGLDSWVVRECGTERDTARQTETCQDRQRQTETDREKQEAIQTHQAIPGSARTLGRREQVLTQRTRGSASRG